MHDDVHVRVMITRGIKKHLLKTLDSQLVVQICIIAEHKKASPQTKKME